MQSPYCASSSTGGCFVSAVNKKHSVEEMVKYMPVCEHICDSPLPSSIRYSIRDSVFLKKILCADEFT